MIEQPALKPVKPVRTVISRAGLLISMEFMRRRLRRTRNADEYYALEKELVVLKDRYYFRRKQKNSESDTKERIPLSKMDLPLPVAGDCY